ncbi:hypothetical protein RND71_040647 [Anisodus tanguticus]|uniref:Uncharacterized protein n=1 Tax=Anisodus tanguticus TaxID=243964 RepID=A0AAE1QT02_9SOLA|nr:hypothetical protein RND71_040647 [Anisodus tanguticus]
MGAKDKNDVDLVNFVGKSYKEKQLLENLKIEVNYEDGQHIWLPLAIPHLQHQVNGYSKELSCPQILRWLAVKSNTKLRVDLFNPSKDEVLYPWLNLTVEELLMIFLASFVSLESELDILIDQFKVELSGVIAIVRESSVVDGACVGGVVVDGGGGGGGGNGDVVGGGVGGVDDALAVTASEKIRDDDDVHGGFDGEVGGYTLLSGRFSSAGVGTSKVTS